MKFLKPLAAASLLLAAAPVLKADGARDILRSTSRITNDSQRSWWLEAGAGTASFTVAETFEGQSLVSTVRKVDATLSYEIRPDTTVNLRLMDAGKSVSATFQLRDHRQRVAPLPCLAYEFQSSSPSLLARLLPSCFAAAAPGGATLRMVNLDDDFIAESGLESPSPDRLRITRDQWPYFPSQPSFLDTFRTVGPGL